MRRKIRASVFTEKLANAGNSTSGQTVWDSSGDYIGVHCDVNKQCTGLCSSSTFDNYAHQTNAVGERAILNITGWLIDGPNRDILYSRRESQRNIL